MQLLSLTLDTPEANLALDEALLDAAEASALDSQESHSPTCPSPIGPSTIGEVLRIWEPADDFVVLGRSSDFKREVQLDACRRAGVPIFRRPSGGGVVVAGPGCLMYAVVLHLETRPELRDIHQAHEYVLTRIAAAVQAALATSNQPTTDRQLVIAQRGISDLALRATDTSTPETTDPEETNATEWLKFSGNSLRLKRTHLLYHGTLLYNFDLTKITRWLGPPKRMPDYRDQRPHETFVANLPAQRDALVAALAEHWQTDTSLKSWPRERTQKLLKHIQDYRD